MNFRAGLTAQVRIPSGAINVPVTVVSATQLRVVVTLTGSSAYTATLVVQNAGNSQAASRTFAVVR
jgi:hypothetical protein